MTESKRRKLPLTGLGLIGAGGVLGVALGMPGAAYAAPETVPTSSGRQARPPASTALLAERLDRAVGQGALTREEADAILAAAEVGLLNGDLVGGPGGHRGPDLDRQPPH